MQSSPPRPATPTMLRPFLRSGPPSFTLPVQLSGVTVAVLAMSTDQVPVFSRAAFIAGVVLAAGFATMVGRILGDRRGRASSLATIAMPTAFGALIGMVVQAVVLGTNETGALRDLGGLVHTTEPVGWILSGIVLGGAPALLVSFILLGLVYPMRRYRGHDAAEAVRVGFGGAAGLLAVVGLIFVPLPVARFPLYVVAAIAEVMIVVAFFADGARIELLRRVYAGATDVDIVPAARFGQSPGLMPFVALRGDGTNALVRRAPVNAYRDGAGEPFALLADTEAASLAAVRRRRAVAASFVLVIAGLAAVSTLPAWLR